MADYLSHIRKRAYSPYYPDVPKEPEPEPALVGVPQEPVEVEEPVAAPSFDAGKPAAADDAGTPAVDYAAEFLQTTAPAASAAGVSTLPAIFNEIDPATVAEQVGRRTIEELKKAARVSQAQNQSDDFDLDEISNYLVAGALDTGMQQHFATTPDTMRALAEKIESADTQLGRVPQRVDTVDDVIRRTLTDNVKDQFIKQAGGDKAAGLSQYREFLGLYQDASNTKRDKEISDLREAESALADEYAGLLFRKRGLSLSTIAHEALKKGRDIAGEGIIAVDRLTETWTPGLIDVVTAPVIPKKAELLVTPEEREEEISAAVTGTLDEAILRDASVEKLTLKESPAEIPPAKLLMPSADAQRRLASKEGARYVVYDDYSGKPIRSYEEAIGTPHIGYGHAIQSAEERELFKQFLAGSGQQMAPDSAKKLFGYDIARHAEPLQLITAPATQQMLDAVHSMTYRLGVQSSEVNRAIELINRGDYVGAAAQIRNVKPTHAGPANAELERAISARHAAEADLFVSGGIFRTEDDSVSVTPQQQLLEEEDVERKARSQADYGDPSRQVPFSDMELPEDPLVNPSELREQVAETLQTNIVELDPIGVTDMFDDTIRNPFISKSSERGAQLAQQSIAALDDSDRSALEVAASLPMGRGFKSYHSYLMRQEQAKARWADLTPQERADIAKEAKSKTLAMIADAKTAELWVSPSYTSYDELLSSRPPTDEEWSLGKTLWGVGFDSPSFLPYMGSGSVLSPQLEIVGRDNDGNILVRQVGATLTALDLLDAVPVVGQSYVIGALENFVSSPIESLKAYGFNPVAAIHQAGLQGIAERRNFAEVFMELGAGGIDWAMSTDAGKAATAKFADSPVGDVFFDPEEELDQRILKSRDSARVVTSFLGAGVGLGAAIFYPFDGLLVGRGAFKSFYGAFEDLSDLTPGVAASIKAQTPEMIRAATLIEDAITELVLVGEAVGEGTGGNAKELKSLIAVDEQALNKLSDAGKVMADVRLRASEGARWVDRLDSYELNTAPENLQAIARPGQVYARDQALAQKIDELINAAIDEAKSPTASDEVKEIAARLEGRRQNIESLFTLHPSEAIRIGRDPETSGRVPTKGLYSFDEHILQLRDLQKYVNIADDFGSLKAMRLQRATSVDGKSLPDQLRELLVMEEGVVSNKSATALAKARGITLEEAKKLVVEENVSAVKTLEEAMKDSRLFDPDAGVLPALRHQLSGASSTPGHLTGAHLLGKAQGTDVTELLSRLEDGVQATNLKLSAPIEAIDKAYQAVYFNLAARRRGIIKLAERMDADSVSKALRPRLQRAVRTFGRTFARELASARFGFSGMSANTTRMMIDAAADQDGDQLFSFLAKKINEPYIARQRAAGVDEDEIEANLYTSVELETMVREQLAQNRALPSEQQKPLIQISRPGFSIPRGLLDTRAPVVADATKAFMRERDGFFSAFGKVPDPATGEVRVMTAGEKRAVEHIVDAIAREAAGVLPDDSVVDVNRKLTEFYTTGVRAVAKAPLIQRRSKKFISAVKTRQQILTAERRAAGEAEEALSPAATWKAALSEVLESGEFQAAELLLLTGLNDHQLSRLRQMVVPGPTGGRAGAAKFLAQQDDVVVKPSREPVPLSPAPSLSDQLVEFVKAEPRTKKAIGEKFGLRGKKLTEFISKVADTGAISVPARGKKAKFIGEAPEAAPAAAKAPDAKAAAKVLELSEDPELVVKVSAAETEAIAAKLNKLVTEEPGVAAVVNWLQTTDSLSAGTRLNTRTIIEGVGDITQTQARSALRSLQDAGILEKSTRGGRPLHSDFQSILDQFSESFDEDFMLSFMRNPETTYTVAEIKPMLVEVRPDLEKIDEKLAALAESAGVLAVRSRDGSLRGFTVRKVDDVQDPAFRDVISAAARDREVASSAALRALSTSEIAEEVAAAERQIEQSTRIISRLDELIGGLDPQADKVRIRRLNRMKEQHGSRIKQQRAFVEATAPKPLAVPEAAETAKGGTFFLRDGSAVLLAFRNADVTTGIHELAHVLRRYLRAPGDRDVLVNWMNDHLGTKGIEGRVKFDDRGHLVLTDDEGAVDALIEAEEVFARAFERYLAEGTAPDNRLKAAFKQIKELFRLVYNRIKGTDIDVDISPEMYDLFDRVFGSTKQLDSARLSALSDALKKREDALRSMRLTEEEVKAARAGKLSETARVAGRIPEEAVEESTVVGKLRQFWIDRDKLRETTSVQREPVSEADALRSAGLARVIPVARGLTRTLLRAPILGGDADELIRAFPEAIRPSLRSITRAYDNFSSAYVDALARRKLAATKAGKKLHQAQLFGLLDGKVVVGAQGRTVRGSGRRRSDLFFQTFDNFIERILAKDVSVLTDSAEDWLKAVNENHNAGKSVRNVGAAVTSASGMRVSPLARLFVGVSTRLDSSDALRLKPSAAAAIQAEAKRISKGKPPAAEQEFEVMRLMLTAAGGDAGQPLMDNLGALFMFFSGNARVPVRVGEEVYYLSRADMPPGIGTAEALVKGVDLKRGDVSARVPGLEQLANSRVVDSVMYAMGVSSEVSEMFDAARTSRLGISYDDFRIYGRGVAGEALLNADEQQRFAELRKRFGQDADFGLSPDSTGDYYLPGFARRSISRSVDDAIKQLSGSDDGAAKRGIFVSLLQYLNMSIVFGTISARPQFLFMSNIDNGLQLGTMTGSRNGSVSAARVAGSTIAAAIRLPGGIVDLLRVTDIADAALRTEKMAPIRKKLADLSGQEVDVASARRAIDNLARAMGDKFGGVIDRFFGGSKYRFEVNPIMDAAPGGLVYGGNYYSFVDLRQIFLEEGIYSTAYKEIKAYLGDNPSPLSIRSDLFRLAKDPESGITMQAVQEVESIVEATRTLFGKTVVRTVDELFLHGARVADAWGETERTGSAVSLMEQGFSPREAARLTVTSLYDYRGSMTKGDHAIAYKLIMPFWSFRKNANKQVINLLGSTRGTYILGVLRRASIYGAETLTDVLFETIIAPYGVQPTALDNDQSAFYYGLRDIIENGLGDEVSDEDLGRYRESLPQDKRGISREALLDYDFAGWTIRNGYNGYSRVPERVQAAVRGMLLARFDVGKVGADYVTLKKGLVNHQLLQQYVQEGLQGAVISEADRSGLPSWMSLKPTISVPLPVMTESAKATVAAGGAAAVHLILPDSFVIASMSQGAAMIMTAVAIADQAKIRLFDDEGVEVDLMQLAENSLRSLVDIDQTSIGVEFIESAREALAKGGGRPVRLHPLVARSLSPGVVYPYAGDQTGPVHAIDSAVKRSAVAVGKALDPVAWVPGYEQDLDMTKTVPAPLRVVLDRNRKRVVRPLVGPYDIPAESGRVVYPRLRGGLSAVWFENLSLLGQVNKILLKFEDNRVQNLAQAEEDLRNELYYWAVSFAKSVGVSVSDITADEAAQQSKVYPRK